MGYVWLGENDWKAIRGREAVFPRLKKAVFKRKGTQVSGGLGLIHGLQAAKYEQQF